MEKMIKVLDKITWEILEKNPNLDAFVSDYGIAVIEVTYIAGFGFGSVDFMGNEIYNSENDEREWVEEESDYEEWELYFRRKIKEIVKMGVINIKL